MSHPTPAPTPASAGTGSRQYDAIVIGGGHNGLVNGAYLAKSGLRTLILERRHLVGGAAITEELMPGFHFTTFSYAVSLLRPDIIHDLDLVRHGYFPLLMPHSFAPADDGGHLILSKDRNVTIQEISRHSRRDADAYDQYGHDMTQVVKAVKPLFDTVPPNLFSGRPEDALALADLAKHLKDLPKRVLHNLVRLLSGSAADFLDDYFESELLKGLLSSSGIIGTKVGPRSQGSGVVLLFHNMGEQDGVFGSWGFHKGGNGGLTQVLARVAQAFGAEIRLEAGVSQVLTSNGRVTGVALADGTELSAPIVVSALDPRRTFLELVEPRELPDDLVESIERYRFQGTSSKVNFALDALPVFGDLDGSQFRGFTNIAPSMDYLERAFDEAKYGWYSSKPYLDCCIQSTIDPDMAPPGKHVMSCFTHYTPYHLKGGDWDVERDRLGDTVQRRLEELFPGFSSLVLRREVVTPLDIERTVGLSEGNIFAGELMSPQLYFFRPAPGWNQYRTPIDGYYQCGSGTHPGGCVTGGPGRLASQQILRDLRRG
ncbi:MAG: NAD(P)-binding protein [Actinobacteria bacterium]|uniref:Pyridine nucleotide-disulfide oxidoreductase domain-containing protein 2 n=1 Tax=freshwater metagenome TaxID=449393 RepID=A0A6J6D9B2_9ZZZZ|nr:NAD(P)-binding protein [Actinomycetota bacterium]